MLMVSPVSESLTETLSREYVRDDAAGNAIRKTATGELALPRDRELEKLSEAAVEERAWQMTVARVELLRRLPSNWDGLGSPPLPLAVLTTAEKFMRLLRGVHYPPPNSVGPSASGSVIFEWHLGERYLEAEIERPDMIEWMDKGPHGVEYREVAFEVRRIATTRTEVITSEESEPAGIETTLARAV